MVHYKLFVKNPASHYVYVDMTFVSPAIGDTIIQLPMWRPGRYEAGNFAKNIKRIDAFQNNDEPVGLKKHGKHGWRISCDRGVPVKVTYSYYAAELTAGSCYSDETQLYINPVHCCMYVKHLENGAHEVNLEIPAAWKVASPVAYENNTMRYRSFDELADSPFFASAQITSDSYECHGVRFHLHFNGVCKPDFAKLKNDFIRFTETQLNFWETFPGKEFHFLFQIVPYKYYHGVEHTACTVIALGPGYDLHKPEIYDELLGVSSHELFHVWNVKTIRPAEMLPYDFGSESPARTGYVYEGFTTYYGDKLLFTSGVFDKHQYRATLEERLQRHLHNFGRFNLGVADSSYDTWLDGYVAGAPYRKTSIYDEGCLVAFLLDVMILEKTGGKKSLRDVCRKMQREFGQLKKGYTESDIVRLVNETSGTDFADFFDKTVNRPADYAPMVKQCVGLLGWQLQMTPAVSVAERVFGFKHTEIGTVTKITLVAPYSPAWKAGLFAGDEIVAVNDCAVRSNLQHWLGFFADPESVNITVISSERLKRVTIAPHPKRLSFFDVPVLEMPDAEAANPLFRAWLTN